MLDLINVNTNDQESSRSETPHQIDQTVLAQSARLAAIGELASGVAHQINNPLTTIIADAQLILQILPINHPARESAEAIEQAGWRAQKVVQLLLEFARPVCPQSGKSVSINSTIRRALTLVGSNLQFNGVSLQVELNEALPTVLGSARQLEDLWVNLFLLAHQATADGNPHTVQVRTWRETGVVVVEFYDDGKPIPPDQIPCIFEPDWIASKIGRGSGIELSICREIVRQHQGQITAMSDPEHGTIFQVRFPVEVQE